MGHGTQSCQDLGSGLLINLQSRSMMAFFVPKWIQDLDDEHDTISRNMAFEAFADPSCHVAEKPCIRCSDLRLQCFKAPKFCSACVTCYAHEADDCLVRIDP